VVSTVSSPASHKPKLDTQLPACTGCGVLVSPECRALQCDKCVDKWKCIDCLGISGEVYDGLIDCKDICWFCTGCGEVMAAKTEDRVLAVLDKVLDKLNGLEDRLQQKADVKLVEGLEQKMESVITQVEKRLNEVEERVNRNTEQLVAKDVSEAVASEGVALNADEERDIERRKNNVILYRVPEIQSEVADDRKAGDMAFFYEICEQGLDISLKSEDIDQMYRLGKRDEGKIRPLLVKCKEEEIKNRIFGRVSELKSADMRFRGVSISHDLTPRQREHVKEVRKKAMEELQAEQERSGNQLNKKIIVVGQASSNPRAIRVAVRV